MLHFHKGQLRLVKQKNASSQAVGNKHARVNQSNFAIGTIRHWRLVLTLLLLVAGLNAVWLLIDHKPFAWDESIHYMGAVGYYRAWLAGGLSGLAAFWSQSDFYPPFIEWLTGTIFLITNPHPDGAAFLNVFYLIIIAILMLMIGKCLFDLDSAVLAIYLFLTASAVSIQSKYFMLDIPMTMTIIAALLIFVMSKKFTQRKWSLLYGVVFALAMLIKWSAVFFLALPPLLTAVYLTIKRDKQMTAVWLNLVLAYGLTALLAFPWYAIHLIKLVRNTAGYFFERGALENDPSFITWQAWLYYLLGLLKQYSLPVGVLAIVGLIWSLLKKKQWPIFLLWVAVPYVIFSFIGNKDYRYTLPLLPVISLYAAWGGMKLAGRKKEILLIGSALLLSGQLLYSHFGGYAGVLSNLFNRQIAGMKVIEAITPDHRQWPLAAILADVQASAKSLGRAPLLRVIPDAAQFSQVTFVVEQSRKNYGVKLASITNWPAFTDYAVTKSGGLGLPFLIQKQQAITESLLNSTTAVAARFEKIQSYDLPDGSQAYLFKRIEKPIKQMTAEVIEQQLRAQLVKLVEQYIQSTDQLVITIEQFSPRETQLGRFKTIKISAENGLVGDFKHKPLGIPFEHMAISMHDLIIDLKAMQRGELLPYALKKMEVNRLQLSDQALNTHFEKQTDELKNCRIDFSLNQLTFRYLNQWHPIVTMALTTKADHHEQPSENLYFNIINVKLAGMPLPGWLIQLVLNDFNPLFKLSGFPVELQLNQIRLIDGGLHLGSELKQKKTGG